MPIMTQRKSFILDEATANCLKRLVAQWQVSPTEAVRRALAESEARLVRADLAQADLEAGYREMAADEAREAEALLWSESLLSNSSGVAT